MGFKKLIGAVTLVTVLMTATAYADVRVVLPSKLGDDPCTTLPGNWAGTGEVVALGSTCDYTGTAVVTEESTATHYKISINLQAKAGSPPICISTTVPLEAICSAGVVTVTSSSVNLIGQATATTMTFTDGSIAGIFKVNYIDLAKS